jgi:hypothetical protein
MLLVLTLLVAIAVFEDRFSNCSCGWSTSFATLNTESDSDRFCPHDERQPVSRYGTFLNLL